MIEEGSAAGIAIGWIMVVAGVVMIVVEAFSPGFFIAVPGTVLIILGLFALFFPAIFYSPWIIAIAVAAGLVSAVVTIWFYGRLTPDASPTTISRDSLVGREGRVLREVNAETLAGKVTIDGVEWSARSTRGTIGTGTAVRVVRSEGVHIVVEEVEEHGD
ncbi:MAG: NfeD family protein [Methanomicrobiaceae archaeon]|nr:NfeD family protein [Methanomicrobiaceae archaeon]